MILDSEFTPVQEVRKPTRCLTVVKKTHLASHYN